MRMLASFRRTAVALVLGALLATPLADARRGPGLLPDLNPIVFVHGGAGSGAQFESQKLRYTINGYPESLVTVLEYDSTFSLNTMADVHAKLDALIAELKQQTGRAQVDVLGHSLGTTVMHGLPQRSGARGDCCPVRQHRRPHGRGAAGRRPDACALGGLGAPGRQIVGATNVTLPNQTHVETATSAESFAAAYEFFTGLEPFTTEVLPSVETSVAVSGRAVIFPQNVGRHGSDARGLADQRQVRPAAGEATGGDPRARRPTAPGDRSSSGAAAATSSRSCARASARTTSTTSRSCATTTSCACSRRSRAWATMHRPCRAATGAPS